MSDPNNASPDSQPSASPQKRVTPEATGGAPRKGSLRLILVVAFLLVVTAIVVWRIRQNNEQTMQEAQRSTQAANRPVPVQTAAVEQRTVPVFLNALGTVTAYNTVTINSRITGQILKVYFTEGQAVKKGELLIQIDPAPYQAALDQAIGQLEKDKATLKNNQAEAQRYTALYNAGVVSKEQEQLQQSNAGTAEGTVKADQASVEAARVNLAYCRITSPIDGVVGLRQVDPGNIVNAGSTTGLVTVTQVHPIAVIFTLPEDQIPQVQRAMHGGHKLTVEAYDRNDAHLIASGTLLTIDNQIDTTTGTAKLKAVFDNADGSLFVNQFVNARLILNERPNATVVPTAAVSNGTQGDFVFVVNPGPTPAEKRKNLPGGDAPAGSAAGKGAKKPELGKAPATGADAQQRQPPFHVDTVPVHVDFTLGTNSVLADGALHAGQQVVVDGQEKLVDGSPVSATQRQRSSGGNAGPKSPTGQAPSANGPSTSGGGTRRSPGGQQ